MTRNATVHCMQDVIPSCSITHIQWTGRGTEWHPASIIDGETVKVDLVYSTKPEWPLSIPIPLNVQCNSPLDRYTADNDLDNQSFHPWCKNSFREPLLLRHEVTDDCRHG